MRMISTGSANKVYHRPECIHAQKIYKRNRIEITGEEAEWRGYRPCKCCNSAAFLYRIEKSRIEQYAEKFHMDVDIIKGKIYVNTDAGCWKIMYKRREQRFILFHRNYVNGRIGLKEAENAPFHRQTDIKEAGSIMKYLKYIKNHDEFKLNAPKDYRQMPRDSKRQKMYYQAAKKRAERHSARRVDQLFALIERQEGIKRLSYC